MGRRGTLDKKLWACGGAQIPQEPIIVKVKGTGGHRIWIQPYGAKVLLDHPKEEKVLESLGADVECPCSSVRAELNLLEHSLRSSGSRYRAVTYHDLDKRGLARSQVAKLEPLFAAWRADAEKATGLRNGVRQEVRRAPRLKLDISPLKPATKSRVQEVRDARGVKTYSAEEEWVCLFFPSLPTDGAVYGKRLRRRMERAHGLLEYLLPEVRLERGGISQEKPRFFLADADGGSPHILLLQGGWGNVVERLCWGLLTFDRYVVLEYQWDGERDPISGHRLVRAVVAETVAPARVLRGWRMLLWCEQGKTPLVRVKEPWRLPGLDAYGVDLKTKKLLQLHTEVETALDRVP